jgi:hypothetical protein
VCSHQFRRSVVVKSWYTCCMGLTTYDPSAWGNCGPGAWHGGITPQLGFLPPCLLASQSSVTFPNGFYLSLRRSKAKRGYNEGAVGGHGRGFGSNASSFHWGPLSQTQVSGRPGWWGAPAEHMVVGLVTQVLKCGGPQISFLLLFC